MAIYYNLIKKSTKKKKNQNLKIKRLKPFFQIFYF
jgi:hypothetical protein